MACRLQMLPACGVDACGIARFQRRDIGKMLFDGDRVALPLARLVPLVVIMEDHGDDVVEIDDEAVVRCAVYQPVEPFVEFGKGREACVDVAREVLMIRFQPVELGPSVAYQSTR